MPSAFCSPLWERVAVARDGLRVFAGSLLSSFPPCLQSHRAHWGLVPSLRPRQAPSPPVAPGKQEVGGVP